MRLAHARTKEHGCTTAAPRAQDSKAQKNGSTQAAGSREAASSFFAPKVAKKNGGPGAT